MFGGVGGFPRLRCLSRVDGVVHDSIHSEEAHLCLPRGAPLRGCETGVDTAVEQRQGTAINDRPQERRCIFVSLASYRDSKRSGRQHTSTRGSVIRRTNYLSSLPRPRTQPKDIQSISTPPKLTSGKQPVSPHQMLSSPHYRKKMTFVAESVRPRPHLVWFPFPPSLELESSLAEVARLLRGRSLMQVGYGVND